MEMKRHEASGKEDRRDCFVAALRNSSNSFVVQISIHKTIVERNMYTAIKLKCIESQFALLGSQIDMKPINILHFPRINFAESNMQSYDDHTVNSNYMI